MTYTEVTTLADETGAEIQRTEREQYTLLELKESDPRGYDQALETLALSAMEYDWWDAAVDDTEHIAEEYGITYDPSKVSFDLDRGSFFSFGPASVDARVLLKRAGIDLRTKDARTILEHGLVMGTSYNYGNERGWIGIWSGDPDVPADYLASDETCDAIRDVLRDAQEEMLSTLRAEQEYLSSAEYLEEHAEINELRFYDDGRLAR